MHAPKILILLSCLSVSACATAPKSAIVPGAFIPKPLTICAGGGSNLPPADAERVVLDYDPTADVRGVLLARAPVDGCLSSGFGVRNGGASSMHKGVDLVTHEPRPIFAAADGVVAEALERKNFGLTILIRHKNGVESRYAHLSTFAPGVKAGARVEFGQEIGKTGKTGNASVVHLHFEVLVDGAAVNPLNVGLVRATS
jgi:murein DD-endopeptidase MepM/ murein hydrolase activator NlpD